MACKAPMLNITQLHSNWMLGMTTGRLSELRSCLGRAMKLNLKHLPRELDGCLFVQLHGEAVLEHGQLRIIPLQGQDQGLLVAVRVNTLNSQTIPSRTGLLTFRSRSSSMKASSNPLPLW